MIKGRKTVEISGVRTLNFPYEIVDGQECYNLHAAVVVEHIVENIPPEAKPAVTVDYDKIPESFHRAVKRKMRIKEEINEQEAREREQRLVDLLEKEGAFSNSTAVAFSDRASMNGHR